MSPSCESTVRHRSSSSTGSSLNCSLPLPSHQNGAHFSDEESDNRAAGRTEPCPLDAKDSSFPDPERQPDGSSATRDCSDDGGNPVTDANCTNQSGFTGEYANACLLRKRKHETTQTSVPTSEVAFQSPPSSQNSPDQSNPKKRLKIGHAGGTTTSNDDDIKPFRDASGHLLPDKSRLLPELWHYVFTFIPPGGLARLLRVNKAFNKFLAPP